ncbi:MAG TPA: DUF5672 family protein [Tepidisphaeraceae bacterium]|jgi:hypothetical protein|nr:DUF5672 family protein [Tepidisphaeraceae bacterium]
MDTEHFAGATKRALLIVCPEGSGSTLLNRLLEAAGWQSWNTGDPRHDVPLSEMGRQIVVKRSLPYGVGDQRGWPDLPVLRGELEAAGYAVALLVLLRSGESTVQSQLRRQYVQDKSEGLANLASALRRISEFVESPSSPRPLSPSPPPPLPWLLLTYEQIIYDYSSLRRALLTLGVDLGERPAGILRDPDELRPGGWDSPKADLSGVTLVCIDTNHPEQGCAAVNRTLRHCQVDKVMFLAPRRPKALPVDAAYVKIEPFASVYDYSRFVLEELHRFIDAPHCLIVQSDGFARNPSTWSRAFLDYDYVGSPWHWQDQWIVGNGGFSLRSRRFLQETAKLGYGRMEHPDTPVPPAEHCEDWFSCVFCRTTMEAAGIRFAPVTVAARFSFECHQPPPHPWPEDRRLTFGFHGERAIELLRQQYGVDVWNE